MVTIGLMIALPAVAEPSLSASPDLSDAPSVPASVAHVSGMAAASTDATLQDTEIGPMPGALPALTRAATQQHVDEMSPMRWLSSYGTVVVGRTE